MTSELEQRPVAGGTGVNRKKIESVCLLMTGNSFFFGGGGGVCSIRPLSLENKRQSKISLRLFGSINLSSYQTKCDVNLTYLSINNENISLVFPGA